MSGNYLLKLTEWEHECLLKMLEGACLSNSEKLNIDSILYKLIMSLPYYTYIEKQLDNFKKMHDMGVDDLMYRNII